MADRKVVQPDDPGHIVQEFDGGDLRSVTPVSKPDDCADDELSDVLSAVSNDELDDALATVDDVKQAETELEDCGS